VDARWSLFLFEDSSLPLLRLQRPLLLHLIYSGRLFRVQHYVFC
jgi:hypothetical protein